MASSEVKIIEYWVSIGKSEGLEPGASILCIEGKNWRRAKAMIDDPDVFYIERVTRWVCDAGGVLDQEYKVIYINAEVS